MIPVNPESPVFGPRYYTRIVTFSDRYVSDLSLGKVRLPA